MRLPVWFAALSLFHLGSAQSSDPDSCQLAQSPQAGAICGDRGYVAYTQYKRDLADNQTVDFSTCQSYCLERRDKTGILNFCEAFAFNIETNLCVLYVDDLTAGYQYYSDSSSPFEFYSAGCFQCQTNCPDLGNKNLVENPGFEISNEAGPFAVKTFTDSTDPHAVVVSPGHNSQNALACNTGCSGFHYARNLCAGQTYTFSMEVQSTVTANYTTMAVSFADAKYYTQYHSTTDWTTIYASFYVTAYRTQEFDIYISSINEAPVQMLFDNVQIIPLQSLPSATGVSIVENGGFELGSLGPWSLDAPQSQTTFSVTSPGLTEGNYAFYYNSTFADNGYGSTEYGSTGYESLGYSQYEGSSSSASYPVLKSIEFTITQQVQMVVGQRYLLSLDFLSPSAEVAVVLSGYTWENRPPANQITTIQEVFAATTTTDKLSLFISTRAKPDLEVYLDNISIRPLD